MKTNTIPPAPSIQTFALDLGEGLRCTVRVNAARMAALQRIEFLTPDIFLLHWHGEALKIAAHFPKYQAWLADILQTISDSTDKSLALTITTPAGRLLCITCEPKSRPDFVLLP